MHTSGKKKEIMRGELTGMEDRISVWHTSAQTTEPQTPDKSLIGNINGETDFLWDTWLSCLCTDMPAGLF